MLLFILVAASSRIYPQIKIDLKKKIERKADREANEKTDRAVDKGYDKMEEGVSKIFKKKEKEQEEKPENGAEEKEPDVPSAEGGAGATVSLIKWDKYDFVPGERLIFEDNQESEQNGEFPSRWDHAGGGSIEKL